MRKPRLGFLGVGWIGLHRLRAIVETGLAEVVAIADPVPENAARAASVAPGSRLTRSLPELLESELDGVVIATPSALHAAQAVEALTAGCAVFCQKPLARSTAEVDAILAAAQRADRRLAVDLSYRHVRALRAVRDMVREGAIGQVQFANLIFHNAYGPDKAWFYRKDLAGGGCVMDLAVHLVDAAIWTLGEEPTVTGAQLRSKGRAVHDQTVEDLAAVSLRFPSGAIAHLACSWNLHAGCPAQIEASFFGEHGGAGFRNVAGSFTDFRADLLRGTNSTTLIEPPDDWGGGAICAWAAGLAAHRGYDPAVEEYRAVSRVLQAIYAQALPAEQNLS